MKYIGIIIALIYMSLDTLLDKENEKVDFLNGCYEAQLYYEYGKVRPEDKRLCQALLSLYLKELNR